MWERATKINTKVHSCNGRRSHFHLIIICPNRNYFNRTITFTTHLFIYWSSFTYGSIVGISSQSLAFFINNISHFLAKQIRFTVFIFSKCFNFFRIKLHSKHLVQNDFKQLIQSDEILLWKQTTNQEPKMSVLFCDWNDDFHQILMMWLTSFQMNSTVELKMLFES